MRSLAAIALMTAPKKINLVDTLRRVPLFADLSSQELALIAERVSLRHYSAGAMVFYEGEPCRELFLVQQGTVKLLKSAANGRRQLLGVERAGSALSEVPVFDGGTYPASAEAVSDTVLLRIDADDFRKICAQYPEVALKVIKVLGHRLRRMGKLVEDLSFSTVRGRLVAYLLSLAEEEGRFTPHGIEFTLAENNEDLAARLGTVRELVSRNLGRLYSEGVIQMQGRLVIVPNLEQLREIVRNS